MTGLLLMSCVLFYVTHLGESWRIFHHGRMIGGNLGKPKHTRQSPCEDAGVVTDWFTQKLDHFNPRDETVWQQRFFSNDQFFDGEAEGPVFLMIGGEGEASDKWMTAGAWVNYSQKFGALMFQLEHRYYGKSRPTANMSVANLKYLSSEQALGDLANFITAMNEKYKLGTEVKWIVFGGSYPGSLAAWMRFKYPHLVHGAVSASGPLLAQVDFQDYFRVIADSLSAYSPECVNAIQQGVTQVDILLKKKIGQKNLDKLFHLCDPIENSLNNRNDISNFYENIADNFAGVVQYNKDNRIGHPKDGNITIDTVCDIMMNQSLGPPVNRLSAVNELLLDVHDEKCLDYKYDKMIAVLKNVSWEGEAAEGSRQWLYQTCTEFGFYQTSSQNPHIFGNQFPIDFYIQQCRDIYGPQFDAVFLGGAVEQTNINYGALNIDVSRVVFVHGSVDPWHALGITKTIEQNAPAIYIEGTAHCANMYPESDDDLPQLKAARVEIESLLNTWLSS